MIIGLGYRLHGASHVGGQSWRRRAAVRCRVDGLACSAVTRAGRARRPDSESGGPEPESGGRARGPLDSEAACQWPRGCTMFTVPCCCRYLSDARPPSLAGSRAGRATAKAHYGRVPVLGLDDELGSWALQRWPGHRDVSRGAGAGW